MSDWIHSARLPLGQRCCVWLEDGSVRHVLRSRDTGMVMFLDCRDPLQNAFCAEDRIKAWRIGDGALVQPLTPDQFCANEALQRRLRTYEQGFKRRT